MGVCRLEIVIKNGLGGRSGRKLSAENLRKRRILGSLENWELKSAQLIKAEKGNGRGPMGKPRGKHIRGVESWRGIIVSKHEYPDRGDKTPEQKKASLRKRQSSTLGRRNHEKKATARKPNSVFG